MPYVPTYPVLYPNICWIKSHRSEPLRTVISAEELAKSAQFALNASNLLPKFSPSGARAEPVGEQPKLFHTSARLTRAGEKTSLETPNRLRMNGTPVPPRALHQRGWRLTDPVPLATDDLRPIRR